jgi:hypothetical protein
MKIGIKKKYGLSREYGTQHTPTLIVSTWLLSQKVQQVVRIKGIFPKPI